MITVTYHVSVVSQRYGRPWLALVTQWIDGERPELLFGNGRGTTATIELPEYSVLRCGQKDKYCDDGTRKYWLLAVDGLDCRPGGYDSVDDVRNAIWITSTTARALVNMDIETRKHWYLSQVSEPEQFDESRFTPDAEF